LIEKIEKIPSLDYGTAGFNKRKYFYNKTGLLIKEMEFEKNDKLVSTFKYYYNEKNQPIKQEYLEKSVPTMIVRLNTDIKVTTWLKLFTKTTRPI
jgi:hypothetical protein